MPTTITKTIGLTGSPDYSTLQAWEDAAPANLVTADQVWKGTILNASDNFSGAALQLTVSGSTVDSTHYKELTTATGASFRDNVNAQTNALRYNASNGCAIECTASYANVISVNEEFARFSNLQVANTGAAGGSGGLISLLLAAGSTTIIDNCIMESARGVAVLIIGSGSKLRNSLVILRRSSGSAIAGIGRSAIAVNCTFAVPSNLTKATQAVLGSYGATTYTNCNFFGATDTWATGSTPTFTTCLGDDATPPTGVTTTTYNTTLFTNITDSTRDYRIPANTSPAYDTGTTDATNAPLDIVGTSRPQSVAYDVGCWELVVAAGDTLRPQACL